MQLAIPSKQAHALYDTLFDWQPPLTLWERSEILKKMLGDEALTSREVGTIEIKKVLEGWVMGKLLSVAYHGEPCLVRVSTAPAMDGQIYCSQLLRSVEVTQALYPGCRRNVFGRGTLSLAPPAPIRRHEQANYDAYRDQYIQQASLQVEARIEHKFQLYKSLDYLLVYVDLFDARNPRFGYFALQEFMEDYAGDLEHRLQHRFRERWCEKIGHLFLLTDKPSGYLTHVAPLRYELPLTLA